jgi:hypothetical protein
LATDACRLPADKQASVEPGLGTRIIMMALVTMPTIIPPPMPLPLMPLMLLPMMKIPRRIASSAETEWRILFRPVYSEPAHSHAGAMQIFWFCMADFPILRLCCDFLDLWRAWRDSNSRPPDS